MAVRVVNGNTFSEDGWPIVDQAGCTWIHIPGTTVTIQVQTGIPAVLLGGAWEADWNAYIEPLEDPTTASWTESNSVLGEPGENNGSNHLGGTAVDSDWERHPMGPHAPDDPRAGFSQAQYDEMQRMKAYYTFTAKDGRVIQLVWWANDWDSPHDSMHSQMGYYTYQYRDEVQDWINTNIRADGFSTYRRGAMPATPPAAQVLSDATGLDIGTATILLSAVVSGLNASQCTNVNRIAMWLAQCGEESAGFSTTEEFASGAEYEGRIDLGNTQPGDGVRFKGRTWIQITGRGHYTEFSQWAFGKGLVSSPTQFVDNPESLADLPWAGVGAAWYWTVERPQINSLCDNGDIVGVTEAINGGTHGLAERTNRYNQALSLGNELLALTTIAPPSQPPVSGDDMAAVPQDEWNAVRDIVLAQVTSQSPFRRPGETTAVPWLQMLRAMDGNTHGPRTIILAAHGHPGSIQDLRFVADLDPNQYPDRADDKNLASAILADLATEQGRQKRIDAAVAQIIGGAVTPAQVTPAVAPAAAQVVYVDRPAVTPAVLPVSTNGDAPPKTTAEIIGGLYAAIDQLNLADALDIKDRATLAATIKILETKNGAQL